MQYGLKKHVKNSQGQTDRQRLRINRKTDEKNKRHTSKNTAMMTMPLTPFNAAVMLG